MEALKEQAIEAPKVAPKEQAIEGVSAPASNGKIQGRWLPGQSGNPSGKNLKRRGDIVRALEDGVSLESIVEVINGLLVDNSWRARHAGATLALSYMYGTPIQRSVTASTKLESILAQVTELSDDEFADVERRLREG
jgi:hypothetical protein